VAANKLADVVLEPVLELGVAGRDYEAVFPDEVTVFGDGVGVGSGYRRFDCFDSFDFCGFCFGGGDRINNKVLRVGREGFSGGKEGVYEGVERRRSYYLHGKSPEINQLGFFPYRHTSGV
jgi:hypothetical protein